MWGTLAVGDFLWISPVPHEALQIGDVVAFHSGGKVVAHRIVGRDGSGFLTQGDFNGQRDSAPLAAGQLIGKVAERERRGVRSAVAGGARGRRRARWLHAACRFWIRGAILLAVPYRMVRASRLVGRFWRPRIEIVRFATPGGGITKLIHRGITVGCWNPQSRQWDCRIPYDLVLSPPPR